MTWASTRSVEPSFATPSRNSCQLATRIRGKWMPRDPQLTDATVQPTLERVGLCPGVLSRQIDARPNEESSKTPAIPFAFSPRSTYVWASQRQWLRGGGEGSGVRVQWHWFARVAALAVMESREQ